MKADLRRQRGRRVLALIFLLTVGSIAFAIAWPFLNAKPPEDTVSAPQLAPSLPAYVPPTPVDSSFAGSAACADCHAEIAARYGASGKGHSLELAGMPAQLESMEHAQFAPPGPHKYRAERADGKLLHHEYMEDSLSVIYDHAEEVAFRIGSGARSHAYLVNREGILYQSPIGYFSDNSTWELAAGFRPDVAEKFGKRIGDECLHCHVGRTVSVEPLSSRYSREVFAEHAIGCERCHGPGQRHVQKQTAGKTSVGRDETIVNPHHLEAERRESVCNQCHLHGEYTTTRHGYGYFDFRPGQLLDDTRVVFTSNQPGDETDPAAVGQVEQMRLSRCYMKSDGALGCSSCHDPHGLDRSVDRQEYFRAKCNQCHADKGCALDEPSRAASPANGSCVHCHMPVVNTTAYLHVARTDHRIMRKPENFAEKPPQKNPEEWQFFAGADHRLPLREISRARGLALMAQAGRRDKQMAMRAELHLVDGTPKSVSLERLLAATKDDPIVLETLGRMYMISERPEEAVGVWQFGLERFPNNEALLANVGMFTQQSENFLLAEEIYAKFCSLNPTMVQVLSRYSNALVRQQKWEEAARLAEQAVKLNPTVATREWLAEVYRSSKEFEKREEQLRIIKRMKNLGAK